MTMNTVIHAAYIVPMDKPGHVILDGTILVRGTQIAYVGKKRKLRADKVLRFPHGVVLPGFINNHTHLSEAVLRGLSVDKGMGDWLGDILQVKAWMHENARALGTKLGTDPFVIATRLALLEMLRFGVTTFRDHVCNYDKAHVHKAIDVTKKAGLRGIFAIAAGDFYGCDGEAKTPEYACRYVESLSQQYADKDKLFIESGVNHAFAVSRSYLKTIFDHAKSLGMHTHLHFSEARLGTGKGSKAEISPLLKQLNALGAIGPKMTLAHCVHLTAADCALIAKKGAKVVHNPEANAYLGTGVAPVAELIKKGVVVATATDGPASNNDMDMIEAMRTACLIQKATTEDAGVLDVDAALGMITREAAKASHLEQKTGTLEEGKQADIVVVGLDQPHTQPVYDILATLVYSAKGTDVDTVMVAGRVLMLKKQVLTLNQKQILLDARKLGLELIEFIRNLPKTG